MPEDFELLPIDVLAAEVEREARDVARRSDRPVTVPAWVLSRLVDFSITDEYIAWLAGQDKSLDALAEAILAAEFVLAELTLKGGE